MVRRGIGIVLFVGLLVAAVMLRDANDQLIDIDYVFGTLTNLPLWLALVGAFSLGAILMALILSTKIARGNLAQRRYRKAVAGLETEVHQLRNLPVDEVSEVRSASDGGV